MKIKIYDAEHEAGLASQMTENSIAFCAKAEHFLVPEGHKILTTANKKEIDLELDYPTKSILASTTWNKNDDVFSPNHTWAARHTPINSPTNIDHDHKKIVGHITDAWVIDEENKVIADDTAEADLPSKFHVCNSAVIYRYSREKDLVTRAEKLIEEIEEGKKFVSMECLFPDFDYAVISDDNIYSIVKREASTAFLTKHLRIYGGVGSYNGHKIGRFLKNMVFSGKGYVDNPANPESIIFGSETEFDFSTASYQNNLFKIENKSIFGVSIDIAQLNVSDTSNADVQTENKIMAEENKVIEKLEAQVANLIKQLADADVKAKNDEIETLKTQLAKSNSDLEAQKSVNEEFKTQVASAKEEVETVKAEVVKLSTANTELSDKVATAEKNQTRAERIAKLINGGVAKEIAEAKVEKFCALSAEQFEEVAEVIVAAVKPQSTTTQTDASDTDSEIEADLSTAEQTEEVVASVGDDEEEDEDKKSKAKAEAVRASIAKSLGWYSDEINGE